MKLKSYSGLTVMQGWMWVAKIWKYTLGNLKKKKKIEKCVSWMKNYFLQLCCKVGWQWSKVGCGSPNNNNCNGGAYLWNAPQYGRRNMIWCLTNITLSFLLCLLVCLSGHLLIWSVVNRKSRTRSGKAMQNKPQSNLSPSRDFTVTTIDAFKLTGKILQIDWFQFRIFAERNLLLLGFKVNPCLQS